MGLTYNDDQFWSEKFDQLDEGMMAIAESNSKIAGELAQIRQLLEKLVMKEMFTFHYEGKPLGMSYPGFSMNETKAYSPGPEDEVVTDTSNIPPAKVQDYSVKEDESVNQSGEDDIHPYILSNKAKKELRDTINEMEGGEHIDHT